MGGMIAIARVRILAAVVAAAAWIGLAVQLAVLLRTNSFAQSLWMLLAYFTILTNILVAVVFTGIAATRGRLHSYSLVAFTMLSILLVAVVNALLLWGAVELSGLSLLADRLLHVVTPALVLLFWIVAAPKGGLTWRDPLLWAIYPLAYLAYALARGVATHRYAYPFLNAAALGWPRTTLNAVLIGAAFIACSYAVVWIDQRFARSTVAIER